MIDSLCLTCVWFGFSLTCGFGVGWITCTCRLVGWFVYFYFLDLIVYIDCVCLCWILGWVIFWVSLR